MDLPVLQIDIVHGEPQCFSYPYACSKKEKKESTVPGVVDHGEELLYIGGVDGSRQGLGKLKPDSLFQDGWGYNVLFHKKMEKGDDGGRPGPYRGDMQTAVLLMLDEGFEVSSFNILEIGLP